MYRITILVIDNKWFINGGFKVLFSLSYFFKNSVFGPKIVDLRGSAQFRVCLSAAVLSSASAFPRQCSVPRHHFRGTAQCRMVLPRNGFVLYFLRFLEIKPNLMHWKQLI